jgi:hypothetical protein
MSTWRCAGRTHGGCSPCVLAGELPVLAPADEAALDAFAGLYDGHIEAEEGIVYPAAVDLLDEQSQRAMGQEMMRRRGVK